MATVMQSTRFYAILDTGYVSRRVWSQKCSDLLAGGADIVQLRAKKQTHAERRELLAEILPLFADGRVPLIINDDLDLALSAPNLGLHIGQDDLSPRAARAALGPARILGWSTHSIDQAQAALALGNVLNYFAVGPVFATATKPTYTAVGLGLVKAVAELTPTQSTAVPWFAIGGINRKTAGSVQAAGARRVVVVSDALCAADSASVVREIKARFE